MKRYGDNVFFTQKSAEVSTYEAADTGEDD
jgi:hypothetical protein